MVYNSSVYLYKCLFIFGIATDDELNVEFKMIRGWSLNHFVT